MNPPVFRPTVNYTPGRTAAISRIVLHGGATASLQELDTLACRNCVGPTAPHCSFHYAVQGCNVRQYVNTADTAWASGMPAVDAGNIDILVIGNYPASLAAGVVCEDCGFSLYSDADLRCLAELVASVAVTFGLNPTSACSGLVHNDELPCFPIEDFIQMVREIMASPAYVHCIPDLPCFCHHETVDGCETDDGLAVWDGGCIKELTYQGLQPVANYTLTLTTSTVAPVVVKGIQIDGNFYLAPVGGIALVFPAATALVTWLNGLGLGTFAVNFIGGTAASWTFSIVSPLNPNVVQLLQIETAGVPSLEPFIPSGATTVPATLPVTAQMLFTLLGIACPVPAPLATCFGLIDFSDDLGGCPIAFALTEFDLTSIGGLVAETFVDIAALLVRVNTLTGIVWTFNATLCRFETSALGCVDFVIGANCIVPPVVITPTTANCGTSTQEVCYMSGLVCRQGNLVIIFGGTPCTEVARFLYDATTGASVVPIPAFVDCLTCGCVNC